MVSVPRVKSPTPVSTKPKVAALKKDLPKSAAPKSEPKTPAPKKATPALTVEQALTGVSSGMSGFKLASMLPIVTLAEAQRDKEDVQLFIVNISDQSSDDHKLRTHVLDLGVNGNNSDLLVIKATWLPQEMSSHMRADILGSPNFRRAISHNLIRIVDTEKAMEVLNTRDAIDENRRLNIAATAEDDDKLLAGAATMINEQNANENKVSLQVADIMRRADLNPRMKLANLKTIERSLTADDLHFIVRSCSATERNVLAWANGVREKRKAKR